MLIALFADIHANREALTACLADAAEQGAARLVFLGDLVGYGPDPVWVVERVAQLIDDGAVAVLGNHDLATYDASVSLSAVARAAIDWTTHQLGPAHRAVLARLPLEVPDEDRLYVHASPSSPADWTYVLGAREAFHGFRATRQRLTFCGHTHQPALFSETASSLPHHHVPAAGRPNPLLPHRRWLAVLGAVGQPRDRNPLACYGLLDTTANRLTYVRVPYDIDVTARKVLAAGLPTALAHRLSTGS